MSNRREASLKAEMVGPYIGLLAYARACGAPGPEAAKRVVDEVLSDPANDRKHTPELIEQIEGKLGGVASGLIRP